MADNVADTENGPGDHTSPPIPRVLSVPILPSSTSTPATATAAQTPSLERRRSLTFRLPRQTSALARIENILEGARERAESLSRENSSEFSPRLQQPLLAHSPRTNPGLDILEESSVDDGAGGNSGGVVGRQPAPFQNTLNYQSTTQTSHSPARRRTGFGRRQTGHSHPTGPSESGGGDNNEHHGEEHSNDGPWKKRLRYFQSIELENKGSVARDHLALERTFLAWLRTSLAFASIGIAITQLFRLNTSLASDSAQQDSLRHLGKPLGSTFLVISMLTLILGYKRYLQAQHWVIKGKFPASRGTIILMTLIAFIVTVASLAVVLAVQGST